MATKGHSTVLQYGNTADYATANSWTKLSNKVMEVTPPTLEAEDIDVSHMETSQQVEEFTAGWGNAGEVQMNCQFVKAEYEAALGFWRTDKSWRIVFFDGATIKFNGYIKTLGTPVERKGLVMCDVTFKVSGPIAYAAAS